MRFLLYAIFQKLMHLENGGASLHRVQMLKTLSVCAKQKGKGMEAFPLCCVA